MSEAKPLAGRTAVVTGASSGIGRAIAEALGGAGARVFLTGRTGAGLEAAAKTITERGGRATPEAFDVRDRERLEAFVERAARETDGLHVMVNNAGLSHPGSIVDGDPEQWREMLEVNVLALLVGSRAAIRAMRSAGSQGHVVNISSIAGSLEGRGVYGATKSAVDNLATTLRQEVENDAIRIVNIRPGAVATSFGRNYDPAVVKQVAKSMGLDVDVERGAHWPSELIAQVESVSRTQFLGAGDVARAVLFAVTQPIHVDIFDMVVRPAKPLPL
jgi:NADP-dependent 3-hydroxy acid dehydrogenase YdfG